MPARDRLRRPAACPRGLSCRPGGFWTGVCPARPSRTSSVRIGLAPSLPACPSPLAGPLRAGQGWSFPFSGAVLGVALRKRVLGGKTDRKWAPLPPAEGCGVGRAGPGGVVGLDPPVPPCEPGRPVRGPGARSSSRSASVSLGVGKFDFCFHCKGDFHCGGSLNCSCYLSYICACGVSGGRCHPPTPPFPVRPSLRGPAPPPGKQGGPWAGSPPGFTRFCRARHGGGGPAPGGASPGGLRGRPRGPHPAPSVGGSPPGVVGAPGSPCTRGRRPCRPGSRPPPEPHPPVPGCAGPLPSPASPG